jgi:hypothetical protein
MDEKPRWKRALVFHGPKDALGSRTDAILCRLGYGMFLPDTFAQMRRQDPSLRADLLLVDERRLVETIAADEDSGEAGVPIVLLTGTNGAGDKDPRIVGAVIRPVGLHELYRLLQQIFEDTPRSTPRIATQLHARCQKGDHGWDGRVLSLSGNGCLIRSPEAIPLGQRISLELTLPQAGSVCLEAEAAYQLLPDIGLVFSAVPFAQREALEEFVTQTILST